MGPETWSEPIAKVYADCVDTILINIARHFPIDEKMSDSFTWQARKLAEAGQVTKENAAIIARKTGKTPAQVQKVLVEAVRKALKDVEPALAVAAEKGFLSPAPELNLSPRIGNVLKSYSEQAVEQLNLVNTVMLDSGRTAYLKVVSDVVAWEQRALTQAEAATAQQILNTAAGEVAVGVTAHTEAVRKAVKQMANAGLTGFVDRGGHHWSPEAYVRMDVRTTAGNVATQAVFARNADYGNDLIWVRTKAAARPLCFPWQGKVLSRDNRRGMVEDLDGNKIEFIPLNETSYGEPAGLFGINCGHTPPNVFIPGLSKVRNAIDTEDPEVEEANARAYELSQKQRALEREVREAKRDAAIADVTGDKELFREEALRVKAAQQKMTAFAEAEGREIRQYRTQVNGYDRSMAARVRSVKGKENK